MTWREIQKEKYLASQPKYPSDHSENKKKRPLKKKRELTCLVAIVAIPKEKKEKARRLSEQILKKKTALHISSNRCI